MSNYYYNKYTALTSYYYYDPSSWTYQYTGYNDFEGCYTSYTLDSSTGIYSYAGSYFKTTDPVYVGTTVYNTNYTNSIYQYVSKEAKTTEGSGNGTVYHDTYSKTRIQGTSYSPGSLVQSNIIAPDGTYPAYGVGADGYFYVRGALVFPALKMNINGTLKTAQDGWVNVNGVLRHIEGMWTNVNGVLKKL